MSSDDELMSAVRAGDRAAFEVLFERYRGLVWRFFRRRVADSEQAADLAQETFLAVWNGADRYEPRGAFRSFLFGIAFNLLAAARRGSVPTDPIEAPPRADSSDPADVIWVRQALAELDSMEREILMLREYEGLSYDEIGALVQVPVGTVRSRLFRAREALREKLVGQPVAQGARR